MRFTLRLCTLIVLLLTLTLPIGAQNREGVMGDLIRDISEVETKVVGLAKAMPAAAYDWRPSTGVRSSGEVFLHVPRTITFCLPRWA